MTVFLRPDLDDTDGAWTPSAGTDLYAAIDEGQSSGSDADYIQSTPATGVSDTCRIRLSNPGVAVAQPMTVTYRYANSGTQAGDLRVRLVQGASTVIASKTLTAVAAATAFTTDSFTLTSLEFGNISDFDDLFVEITATGVSVATPALDIDFTTGTLDSKITFTRSTTATYYNSSGVLSSAATNTARFDYQPVSPFAARGLLFEEARTNVLLRTEDLTQSAWTKQASSITANNTTAPDGTSTADLVTITSTGSGAGVVQQPTYPGLVALTLSVYAKAGTSSFFCMNLFNGVGNDSYNWFNLSTGAAGTTGSGTTSTIQDVGGGWFRCTCTRTVVGTAGWIAFIPADSMATFTATAGNTVNLWGAQLEAGDFATSYIPTTSASVTRAGDVANLTSTNFSSWYTNGPGTIVFHADAPFFNYTRRIYWICDSSTYNESITASVFFGISAGIADGGVNMVSGVDLSTGLTVGVKYKHAFAFDVNNAITCLNGTLASAADTSVTLPTVDRMAFGAEGLGGGGLLYTGHFQRFTYYNTRLADAALQTLTT
jgi:hypothetical protein